MRATQQKHPGTTTFRGAYFSVENGTPMECWLGRELELAASYEAGRYGLAHAVSFVNWPTLDVMRHPTEIELSEQTRSLHPHLPAVWQARWSRLP